MPAALATVGRKVNRETFGTQSTRNEIRKFAVVFN